MNWKNNNTPDKSYNGYSVTVDDTASNYNVQLNAYTVTPAALVFNNNSHDYTLSGAGTIGGATSLIMNGTRMLTRLVAPPRSEEHTSELQSQSNIACRLLLEKQNHCPEEEPAGYAHL